MGFEIRGKINIEACSGRVQWMPVKSTTVYCSGIEVQAANRDFYNAAANRGRKADFSASGYYGRRDDRASLVIPPNSFRVSHTIREGAHSVLNNPPPRLRAIFDA
jgi:hypothetical protein